MTEFPKNTQRSRNWLSTPDTEIIFDWEVATFGKEMYGHQRKARAVKLNHTFIL